MEIAVSAKMHADELDVDGELVAALVAEQFPQWAELPVVRVLSSGTDNAMFRLGSELVARLPRIPAAARQVAKEQRWLPHLAPSLPLDVPLPVGHGRASEAFPLPWSVYGWLDGADAAAAPPDDLTETAQRLGEFVCALERVPLAGGPTSFRGGPVIDFGGCGTGDPACDVMAAWTILDEASRPTFRAATGVDDHTWARGRGWAFCFGVGAWHYYEVTNPALAAVARPAALDILDEVSRWTGALPN